MQRYSDKTDKTVAELVVPNGGGSSPFFGWFVEELFGAPSLELRRGRCGPDVIMFASGKGCVYTLALRFFLFCINGTPG